MVLRMVMDSLRYWVEVMGVDGFRFDLAATLARRDTGFDPRAPLLDAIRQDPVLAGIKLIAEPWDIGPQWLSTGRFPRLRLLNGMTGSATPRAVSGAVIPGRQRIWRRG